jgi:drug/metabolite transporter (DMT)-like permease
VFLAGLLLLTFLAWRGRPLRLTGRDFVLILITSLLFFVGGNGMLTRPHKTDPRGVAAIRAATTPIWVAVLGLCWPNGERLSLTGWLGLLVGLLGVTFLLVPELQAMQTAALFDPGPLLMIGSTLCWAVGILLLRHAPAGGDHLVSSGYQMAIGGGLLSVIGVLLGEVGQMPEEVTAGAVTAFLYLLVIGSLLGFIAFNFLLRNVSAALVGTHAYVNPIIALVIGGLLDGEEMTGWIAAGILSVLVGVFLVRSGHQVQSAESTPGPTPDTDHPRPHPELDEAPVRN